MYLTHHALRKRKELKLTFTGNRTFESTAKVKTNLKFTIFKNINKISSLVFCKIIKIQIETFFFNNFT